jgi:hypothetical protein
MTKHATAGNRPNVIGLQERRLDRTIPRTDRTKVDLEDVVPNGNQLRLGPRKANDGLLTDMESAVAAMKSVPWTTLQEMKGDNSVLKKIEDAEELLKSLREALTSTYRLDESSHLHADLHLDRIKPCVEKTFVSHMATAVMVRFSCRNLHKRANSDWLFETTRRLRLLQIRTTSVTAPCARSAYGPGFTWIPVTVL